MKIDKNIVLIGFMGVGKGTIARELAKQTGIFAIDGDDMIESFANKKIKEIFEDDGEDEFRKIELNLAKFLEKSVSNAIISTGGGFYKVKNLNKIGTVIYLKSSFEKIIDRMKKSSNCEKKFAKRPLLSNLEKAKELHDQRDKEYEKKADFVVIIEDKSAKQIAKEIIKFIQKGKN
ncbi:shikimate kinase [Campylobacter iguaniorum]|uniref:Shikimate kinase n=1 Tax=Campylobacter iguaniorum TaxID=1244531 RepID=A0A076FAD3_9BACT|nr:shikimate kinase [Campylobacter iguaniorum]AII15175.1 shikimate kinase [Campylobacter iguaniorum]